MEYQFTSRELIEKRTESLNGNNDALLFLGTERGLAVLNEIIKKQSARIVAVCVQDTAGHGADAALRITDTARKAQAEVFNASEIPPSKYFDFIKAYNPAVALCVNWRKLFPTEAVHAPARGLIVAHDSLLPHLRGFAPLNHSIRNGEEKTGVTLFYANEATDAGDIIDQRETHIGTEEYVSTVRDRVTQLTAELVAHALPLIIDGKIEGMPQNQNATYGVRLTPEDGAINFQLPSRKIFNLIRATSDPYPGAFAHTDPERKNVLRVWKASMPHDAPRAAGNIPGRVLQMVPGRGVFVCTGEGAILLQQVQRGDDMRTSAENVLNRYSTTLY